MRNIKFRAWIPAKKVMWYDILISFIEGFIYNKPRDYIHDSQYWEVEYDYILLEYTGLKDKNDVEIYEGDIVEYTDNYDDEVKIGVIDYYEEIGSYGILSKDYIYGENKTNHSRFTSLYKCGMKLHHYSIENVDVKRVIGNIYENFELLKI